MVSLCGAVLAAAALGAFVAASRGRLRRLAEEGVAPAKRLAPLIDRPASTAAALAASDTLLALAALLCAVVVAGAAPSVAAAAAVLVGAVLVLLIGHAIAWAAAVERPEATGLALAGPIQMISAVVRPLVGGPAARIAGRFGGPLPAVGDTAQRDLAKLVEVVEENGSLEEGEQRMIHGIVELGDRTVREVMVPRIDMVAVPEDATVAEAVERIRGSGHSRIPVYRGSIDDVVGILYAKDLLHQMPSMDLESRVGPLVREPQFVPETKRVDELLHEMQDAKVHIAIVVDEYGGTAGLITIEDLLEEIVGEIRDEYDVAEETWIEPVDSGEAVFDGRVSIHDVNSALSLQLDDAEYDTLGGLLYARLGKVPTPGDTVDVGNARITVLSTLGRRVRKVRVAVSEPPRNGVAH